MNWLYILINFIIFKSNHHTKFKKNKEMGVPEVCVSEEGVYCENRHEAFILLKLFHNLFAI